MQEVKRLSLDDFKLNKLDNKTEIDKLLGDAAADCHPDDDDTDPMMPIIIDMLDVAAVGV